MVRLPDSNGHMKWSITTNASSTNRTLSSQASRCLGAGSREVLEAVPRSGSAVSPRAGAASVVSVTLLRPSCRGGAAVGVPVLGELAVLVPVVVLGAALEGLVVLHLHARVRLLLLALGVLAVVGRLPLGLLGPVGRSVPGLVTDGSRGGGQRLRDLRGARGDRALGERLDRRHALAEEDVAHHALGGASVVVLAEGLAEAGPQRVGLGVVVAAAAQQLGELLLLGGDVA